MWLISSHQGVLLYTLNIVVIVRYIIPGRQADIFWNTEKHTQGTAFVVKKTKRLGRVSHRPGSHYDSTFGPDGEPMNIGVIIGR